MSLKRIIGITALSYPEIRNFAAISFDQYTFKKIFDLYKFPSFILFKLKHKINRKWQNSFQDFGLNRCDFFHFFNVISFGNKPYITTYETTLPRWNDSEEDFKKGLEIIANKSCKNIIALSECAYKKQEAIILKYRPDLLEAIMTKNSILLPPQIPLIQHFSDKKILGEKIIFTIVGADFFRKGGSAILDAFDNLLTDNKPVCLNIVSTLNYGDYASKTTDQDLENALRIINKHPGKITLFNQLTNKEVQQLLVNTDVAMLPSLAETFGYFILEAQAAGCPVITTDIRAMPEINNEKKGWLIQIREKNEYDADLKKRDELLKKISLDLTSIILSIIDNPSIIRLKGALALEDIIFNHSPEKHKAKLLDIYDKIQ